MTENDGGERSRWLGVSSAREAEPEGGQGPASTSRSRSPTWAANPLPPTLVGQGRGCTPAALKTINKDANQLVRAFLKKRIGFAWHKPSCIAKKSPSTGQFCKQRSLLSAGTDPWCARVLGEDGELNALPPGQTCCMTPRAPFSSALACFFLNKPQMNQEVRWIPHLKAATHQSATSASLIFTCFS